MSKVLVETSVLLAGSIHASHVINYEHRLYGDCKGLLNLFKQGFEKNKIFGVTTDTVIEQSWNALSKAINDVVNETHLNNKIAKAQLEFYNIISSIKDVCEDRLRENIRILNKYPVDKDKINSIILSEVDPFFKKTNIEIENARSVQIPILGVKLRSSTKRSIQRVATPYFKGVPDIIDRTILSEAIYIKRNFLAAETLFLASLDTHFSPPHKDHIVRDNILETFSIACDWPCKIRGEIRKEISA